MKTLSVSTISGAAIGRWPYILSALGIKVPSAGHHGACPACGGKDRFRLDDKAGRGTWFCNQCGHGDGLDLVRLVTGRKVKEVAGMVSEVLALPEILEKPALPARKKAAGKEAGAERYTRLRQQSCNGEPVYLTNKGLHGYSLPLLLQPLNLAGITFSSGSLLLPLTDISGNITGGQLINPDGDKSLLPGSQLSGAFIALTDIPAETPEQVIITEGFATALTVSLLTEGWIVAAVAATNLLKVTEQIR
ncbi:primase-helicase zinc-binding domain-containing protein, partial [Salmonella enterica subsp. enterica serovar London]